VLKGCWRFLQDNTNPITKKNMDDRKRGGEERIAEHTAIGMTIRKLFETYDTRSRAKFNLMEKTALNIRHLVDV
jgi:hypothetical protein